jgi:hypothetical protein
MSLNQACDLLATHCFFLPHGQERIGGLGSFLSSVIQERHLPANAEMLAKFLMARS